jgi:hypothetical protein
MLRYCARAFRFCGNLRFVFRDMIVCVVWFAPLQILQVVCVSVCVYASAASRVKRLDFTRRPPPLPPPHPLALLHLQFFDQRVARAHGLLRL